MPSVAEPLARSTVYRVLSRTLDEVALAAAEETKAHTEPDADTAAVWSEVTRVCLRLPGSLEDLWQTAVAAQHSGGIYDHEPVAAALREMFARYGAVLDLVERMARAHEQAGIHVQGATRLPVARGELAALRAEIRQAWPWFDRQQPPVNRQMVQESYASRSRGESQNVRDILRELGAPVEEREKPT